MKKKNIINSILQNTRMPEGFFGRIILRGMNKGHASLSRWGLSQIEWKSDWTILDIGCGGGANLKRMADFCPQGKIYGIDISSESVKFARKEIKKLLNTRCFISQGNVMNLPYEKGTFDLITAFETVYFWGNLQKTDVYKRQPLLSLATSQEYNEKLFNPSTASWHLALIWLTVRQAKNHITEYSRTAVTFIVYYQTFLKRTTVHVARTNGAVSVVIPMRIPAICNTVLNSTAAVASPKPFKDAVPSAIAQSTPLYPCRLYTSRCV